MLRVTFLLGYVIQLAVAVQFPESLKHDYKISLKYPFNNTALGFQVGGDVTYAEHFIRISPSIGHKNGYVISDRTIGYDNLMIDLVISVNGRGFVGGNGMGIWITDVIKGGDSGSYYGRNEDFKGTGIILSTSDGARGRKDPYIFGIQNDGHRKAMDFAEYTSKSSAVLGGCFSNYRNMPDKFHLRIMILNHKLSVFTDSINHGKGFTECFTGDIDEHLSAHERHIGISANSLNIADDHDLVSLDVYEINPAHRSNEQKKQLSEEDKEKIDKIQHIVDVVEDENHEKEEYGDAVTGITVQHIMENQFHVLSKLDILIKEIKDNGNHGSSQANTNTLEGKIDIMVSRLSALNEKIKNLEDLIEANHGDVEQDLSRLHSRVSKASDTFDRENAQHSKHLGKAFSELNSMWSWVKFTLLVFVVSIFVYGILAMIRKKEDQRKFI